MMKAGEVIKIKTFRIETKKFEKGHFDYYRNHKC